ncbi:hypothetical protein C8R44DRAFT_438972 [Mycena epipterygia]|nr:hypothetical protein C8R44DRAFT_438972 [Mycena epipterygia]
MAQSCWKCGVSPAASPAVLDLPPASESSPDLTRLLTNNDVPPESALPHIHRIITNELHLIDVLDIQIDHFQATIAHLLQRRDAATECARQHQAIISSVRRIPPELICEIFALSTTERRSGGNMPPWRLGHICRSWRQSALSYPLFWRSIDISSAHSSPIAMIETQLLRSGNARLDLRWRGGGDPVTDGLANLLRPHLGRCSTIHLHNLVSSDALDWLHPGDGIFSQLQMLEVLCHSKVVIIPDVLCAAPNLREVILTEEDFSTYSPSIVVPWGQITHYRGTYSLGRQREILQSTTNLLECHLAFDGWLETLENGVIKLPLLCRLRLEEGDFLVHLTTPLLQSLFVVQNLGQGVLLPFIHRSSCRLTKLVLLSVTMLSEFIPVLKSLPTLTYLLLQVASTSPQEAAQTNLFNAMCTTDSSPDLCPNLSSMLFGYPSINEFPADAFFAMAESRFQTPSRLQVLRIFCSWKADSEPLDIYARIQVLRGGGFDAAFWDYDEMRAELTRLCSS